MRKAAGVLPAGSIRAEYITSLHGNVTVKNGKAEARVRWATFVLLISIKMFSQTYTFVEKELQCSSQEFRQQI